MNGSRPRIRYGLVLGGVTALLTACAGTSSPPSLAAPPGIAAPGPPALTARAGDLPRPVRQVLPNGLRLIVQDHRAADIVAVYLYVGVGVRYEKPDQLGFAHFQEHMLFKGTDKWGAGYIDRAVEGVGGRTNATTSFDYTDFSIVAPAEALETAVQTLADMALRSTFAPVEVDRERQVILARQAWYLASLEVAGGRPRVPRALHDPGALGDGGGRPARGRALPRDAAHRRGGAAAQVSLLTAVVHELKQGVW